MGNVFCHMFSKNIIDNQNEENKIEIIQKQEKEEKDVDNNNIYVNEINKIINTVKLNSNFHLHTLKFNGKLINKGSYGEIYDLGNKVFKNIKFNGKFIPKNFYREMSLLKELDGFSNIIQLKRIIAEDKLVGFILPKCNHNIKEYISNLTNDKKKHIIYQILLTLNTCHSIFIIHRDIKPSNILIQSNNVILCDFGISKSYYSKLVYNRKDLVQTIWYRAPEILFETNYHSTKMDIWSVGIMMIEFFQNSYGFLSGLTESSQIKKIIENFGLPRGNVYKDISKIFFKYNIDSSNINKNDFNINDFCKKVNLNKEAEDLLNKMLQLDPIERISTCQALNHPYFKDIHKEENIIKIDLFDLACKENYNLVFNTLKIINNETRIGFLNKLLDLYKKNLKNEPIEEILFALNYFDIILYKIDIDKLGIDFNQNMCIYIMLKVITDNEYNYETLFDSNQYKKIIYFEIYYLNQLNYKLLFNNSLNILTRISLLLDNIMFYHMSIYLYLLFSKNYLNLKYSIITQVSTILEIIKKFVTFEENDLIKKFDKKDYVLLNNIIGEHNDYILLFKNDEIYEYCRENIPILCTIIN